MGRVNDLIKPEENAAKGITLRDNTRLKVKRKQDD